jgi:hypothetical protein
MKTDPALLGLVPVGDENAVTARLLWQVNRVGAVATAKCKLNMMASKGIVRRKKIWRGPSEATLYWKQMPGAKPSPLRPGDCSLFCSLFRD